MRFPRKLVASACVFLSLATVWLWAGWSSQGSFEICGPGDVTGDVAHCQCPFLWPTLDFLLADLAVLLFSFLAVVVPISCYVQGNSPREENRKRIMESSSSSSSKRTIRVQQKGDPELNRQIVQEFESSEAGPVFRTRTQLSSKDSEDGGVRTVHTTRVIKHMTTSHGDNKTTTETFVTSSSGDTRAEKAPFSSSVIEKHLQTSPDVRSVTRTTTKVIKQGIPSGNTTTTTTTTQKSSSGGNLVKKSPASLKTVEKTSRKVVSGKIEDRDRKKTKISDIITGLSDESVTAREALLQWAQCSTERYPGVKVSNFTSSWKNGLAFNAIIHRNRPDLLDFHSLNAHSARENLEKAFSIAEKEFGITRLLDPEDVDTPELDEKSIITYISSIYDVFPDPPSRHPLAEEERHSKVEEYKELCIRLQMWILESVHTLKSRAFFDTIAEMKTLLSECSRFRSEDIPKRIKEKQKLVQLHKEIQRLSQGIGQVTFEGDLKLEAVEKNWELMLSAHQERDQAVRGEISRLEKLQKVADKISRDIKLCDNKLDDVDKRIKEELKRVERLQTPDAKHNCEQIESAVKSIEDQLETLRKDTRTLFQNNFHQAPELERRINALQDRFSKIRRIFQLELLSALSVKTIKVVEEKIVTKQKAYLSDQKSSEIAKALEIIREHSEFVEKKMKKLKDSEWGDTSATVKVHLEQHRSDHKSIENYKRKITNTESALQKITLTGNDHAALCDAINILVESYKNLLDVSAERLKNLEASYEFLNSASKELRWVSEKIEVEVSRDWSSNNLNLAEIRQYQEVLTTELEKRESYLTSIQKKGEILIQKHPSPKCIENLLVQLQKQWSYLLQLAFCLEIHLKHAHLSQQYFKDGKDCERHLKSIEDKLNTNFSRAFTSVDEGEKILKQIHKIRDNLSNYSNALQSLSQRSSEVISLKQRRKPISKPVKVMAICNYLKKNISISKDHYYILQDNSQQSEWKVLSRDGSEIMAPSVCFIIPPPSLEVLELYKDLKTRHDAIVNLWAIKEKTLRQNLIVATIKVVKSWDISQFRSMETIQRESIIRALNEDTEKLLAEGSGEEPILIQLKTEMENCNKLFKNLQEKIQDDERDTGKKSSKSSSKKLHEELQNDLNDKLSCLRKKLNDPIRWNLDVLENLVLDHKDFELDLRRLEEKVKEIKSSTKKPLNQYDNIISTWDKIWELSNLFIERLKALEVTIHDYEEAARTVSSMEVQLASFEKMSSNMEELHSIHDKLMLLQTQMLQQQSVIDVVSESFKNVKNLVHLSRPKQSTHNDLNKFQNDIKKLNTRWNNISTQIIERLRSCGGSSELLRTYQNKSSQDRVWLSETSVTLNTLKSVKTMTTNEVEMHVEPAMNLYSSIADQHSSFEHTNLLGARYIREAKIYDLRLKHYKESLEEEHPSLDASLQKRPDFISGAEIVARDLEDLNQQYGNQVQLVLNYLAELKLSFSKNNTFKLSKVISKATPISLKTFHTAIDQAPALNSCSLPTEQTPFMYSDRSKLQAPDYKNEMSINIISIPKVAQFSADTAVLCPTPEDESKDLMFNIPGILDTKSGEKISLKKAIQYGIIDPRTLFYNDLSTGRALTLTDAVKAGYVDSTLYEGMTMKCGIFYPDEKEELSLLEAIKRNLYDVNSGKLLNPQDGRPISFTDAFHIGILKKNRVNRMIEMGFIKMSGLTISEAVQQEFLNPKSGLFKDPLTGLEMNFSEAVDKGLLIIPIEENVPNVLSLAKAIDKNIVQDGQFTDEDSGETFQIKEAVTNGVLSSDICEIFDLENFELVDIGKAIERGIIDADKGKYIDKRDNSEYSFEEARCRDLIFQPLTVNEALAKNLISDDGLVCNPWNVDEKLSIIDALAKGILDSNSKCIVHPSDQVLLSLPSALKKNILTPAGTIIVNENDELALKEGRAAGFVADLSYSTIFELESVKEPSSGNMITFNEALLTNIIDLKSGVYENSTNQERITLQEAANQGILNKEVFSMLNSSIGVKDGSGVELTVSECINSGIIDSKTGTLHDPKTKTKISVNEAIRKNILTPQGALIWKGLLNIPIATVTKTQLDTVYVKAIDTPKSEEDSVTVVSNTLYHSISFESRTNQVVLDKHEISVANIDTVSRLSSDSCTNTQKQSTISSVTDGFEKARTLPSSVAYSTEGSVQEETRKKLVTEISDDKANFNSDYGDLSNKNNLPFSAQFHSLSIHDEESSASVDVLDLPPSGWYLNDAILKNLLNPHSGIFKVPGTGRTLSFEEAIKMEIINPNSAHVKNSQTLQMCSLKQAFKDCILDSFGNYCSGNEDKKLSLNDAILRKKVVFSDGDSFIQEQLTRVELGQHVDNKPIGLVSKPILSNAYQTVSNSEYIEIQPDIYLNRKKLTIYNTLLAEESDLKTAALSGTIDPSLFNVKIDEGSFITLDKALAQNIIHNISGNYSIASDAPISFSEAFTMGYISIGKTTVEENPPSDMFINKDKIPFNNEYDKHTKMEHIEATNKVSPSHSKMFWPQKKIPDMDTETLPCMKKIVLSPYNALQIGFIDNEAFAVINEYFLDSTNNSMEAVNHSLIDGDKGGIMDIKSSQMVPIRTALDIGILDFRSGNIHIPIGRPLSIPEACDKGLIDPQTSGIIHPVTGLLMSVRNAISCDVINPYSLVKDQRTNSVKTLEKMIDEGLIDSENNIKLSDKQIDLIDGCCVHKLFLPPEPNKEFVASLAPTLPVAVQYNVVDLSGSTYTHPFSKASSTLEEAIKNNVIMVTPVTKTSKSIVLWDALKQGLINFKENTFQHPECSTSLSLYDAMAEGLLIIEPTSDRLISSKSDLGEVTGLHESKTLETVAEHSEETQIPTFLDAYEKHLKPEAGVFLDPHTSDVKSFEFLVKNDVFPRDTELCNVKDGTTFSLDEALKKKIIDPESGKFFDTESGTKMYITEAVKLGLITVLGAPILTLGLASCALKSLSSKLAESSHKNPETCRNTENDSDSMQRNADLPTAVNMSKYVKQSSFEGQNVHKHLVVTPSKVLKCTEPSETPIQLLSTAEMEIVPYETFPEMEISQNLLTNMKVSGKEQSNGPSPTELQNEKKYSVQHKDIAEPGLGTSSSCYISDDASRNEQNLPIGLEKSAIGLNNNSIESKSVALKPKISPLEESSLLPAKSEYSFEPHPHKLSQSISVDFETSHREDLSTSLELENTSMPFQSHEIVDTNTLHKEDSLSDNRITNQRAHMLPNISSMGDTDSHFNLKPGNQIDNKIIDSLPLDHVESVSQYLANDFVSTSSYSSKSSLFVCSSTTESENFEPSSKTTLLDTTTTTDSANVPFNGKNTKNLLLTKDYEITGDSKYFQKEEITLLDKDILSQSTQARPFINSQIANALVQNVTTEKILSTISTTSLQHSNVMKTEDFIDSQKKIISEIRNQHMTEVTTSEISTERSTLLHLDSTNTSRPNVVSVCESSKDLSQTVQRPSSRTVESEQMGLIESLTQMPTYIQSEGNVNALERQKEPLLPSMQSLPQFSEEMSTESLISAKKLSHSSHELHDGFKTILSDSLPESFQESGEISDSFPSKNLPQVVTSLSIEPNLKSEPILSEPISMSTGKDSSEFTHPLEAHPKPSLATLNKTSSEDTSSKLILKSAPIAELPINVMQNYKIQQHSHELPSQNNSSQFDIETDSSSSQATKFNQEYLIQNISGSDKNKTIFTGVDPTPESNTVAAKFDVNTQKIDVGEEFNVHSISSSDSHSEFSCELPDRLISFKNDYNEDTPHTLPDFVYNEKQHSNVGKEFNDAIQQLSLVDTARPLTITKAMETNQINVNAAYIIIDSEKVSVKEALTRNLINNHNVIKSINGTEIILAQGNSEGVTQDLVQGVSDNAVEDNYKICRENTAQLLTWIEKTELQLAGLGLVKEDLSALQLQINATKALKDELMSQQHLVNTCIDQVRQLVQQGFEILSKEEVHGLQKDLQTVKKRYDLLISDCDQLLHRLVAAFEELQKFKTEIGFFKEWLELAQKNYKEKETSLGFLGTSTDNYEKFREFSSDVIAHQADIRFITMSAQKFVDESKEYLKILNVLRVNLPQRLPHMEPAESEVKAEVKEVTVAFMSLLNSVNKLGDNFTVLCDKHRYYLDTYDKAICWLNTIQIKVKKALDETISAEPSAIQEQLDHIKTLNMEIVGQGRLIENTEEAVRSLQSSLDSFHVDSSEANEIELSLSKLKNNYGTLAENISTKIKEIQVAFIQSQDITDGLDRLIKWLDETESAFHSHCKPMSLDSGKLDGQIQEFKILQSDINNEKQSIETVNLSAKKLLDSNPKSIKKIESKLKDIAHRYQKVCDSLVNREILLQEVSTSLRTVNSQSLQFEDWVTTMLDKMEDHDVNPRFDVDGFASVIEYSINQRNAKLDEFEELMKSSKTLSARRDVADSSCLKEKIKNIEHLWKTLDTVLSEKQSMSKTRAEQLAACEALRQKVTEWLRKMEVSVERLELVSLDYTELKKQTDEIKVITKEYNDYNVNVEKLNKIGNSYDVGTKDYKSNRKLASPIKKGTSPIKKSPSIIKSPDSLPSSPSKGQLSSQSPLSTASSGFGSRKNSSDNFTGIEDLSPLQQQLSEINHRYSLLGVKLNDRSQELNQLNSELKNCSTTSKMLLKFLETKKTQLPKEGLPTSKEEAESYEKILKVIQNEFIEKQCEMDNLKSQVHEILKRKGDINGSSKFQENFTEIDHKWEHLQSTVKKNLSFLENFKNFQDTYTVLHSWLLQREKMFQVLGPISSDPRMVSSQAQQVLVMREEFSSQNPSLDHFNQSGNAVKRYLDSVAVNTKKITEQMTVIDTLWQDLIAHLEDRNRNLENAGSVVKTFYKTQSQIQENLQKISDSFDQCLESKTHIQDQVKKLHELEENLEKQRPLLTDANSICDQLCEVLSDSFTKNDVRGKLNLLEKFYSALSKKISTKKVELESCLKEDYEFHHSCDNFQDWLEKTGKFFLSEMVFSADLKTLTNQAQEFEPKYKSFMDKEHELYLLASKGSDISGKGTSKSSGQPKTNLDSMQIQYGKIKKIALDRHTRLKCCLENCSKFQSTVDNFLPWLEKSEEKLASIKISNIQRPLLNKQIKELQVMKTDVTKHIQEFETIRQLGNTLIESCTGDREKLKKQLAAWQKSWESLNQEIGKKMQSFEDLSNKLGEYQEKLRDLQHAIQRLEDKIASHDAIGTVSRDPILLGRIKSLQQESIEITKQLDSIKEFVKKTLLKSAGDSDSSDITKELKDVEEKLHSLKESLNVRLSNLSTATKLLATFNNEVKSIHVEIEKLETILNKMKPVARDKKVLLQQVNEIKDFKIMISKLRVTFENAEKQCRDITSKEFLPDSKACEEQLTSLQKQISRMEEHIKVRETSLETVLTRINSFFEHCHKTRRELDSVTKEERTSECIATDVESIRLQQTDFKKFRAEKVQPVHKMIEEGYKMGEGVIQSASAEVSTNELEQELDSLNEHWNKFQERITEREKKLDVALLQSGKFQEAMEGVQKWLIDTEEMVHYQKSPSSDYKVVKAQVQEQKFLKKMLLDRQNSVVSLKVTGTELMQSTATQKEKEQVDGQMVTIINRFEELSASADERMKLLERTCIVAQEFQNALSPLTEWIEESEKKLTAMAVIPVENTRIRKLIKEHKVLQEDILSRKKELDKMKTLSEKLKQSIGKDDFEALDQKVQLLLQKYSEITEACSTVKKDLSAAEKGLTVFSEKYDKSISAIEKYSTQLSSFQTFSIYVDKLQTQTRDLKKLKETILKEKSDVGIVVSTGQELMKHASGEDTIQVKQKLDTLNVKFVDVLNRVEERLKVSEEMFPLVKSFHEATVRLSKWLESTERSIKILETACLSTQETTIKKLQTEIHENRTILEIINHNGPKICQLSQGNDTSVIESTMSKINHRFDVLTESVQRKAERIELAVQRKFDVVGDIDEVLDWFKDIEKQVVVTEGLSPEPSSLQSLLNVQKSMNNEIISQKIRVRDILTAAKKLMRESSTEDLSHIHEKVETLKTLSNNISTVCQDRLSIIEQALPLAEHFFETHTDLIQWLDAAENEVQLLEAPALNSVKIKKQEEKNKVLAQSVTEHKPLVDKLNKTGSALSKLCKEDETEKVEVILESDNSRYNALRQILREHQSALEEALQATSQFSDKLEGMLSALTSTADQIQNAEPISAHPERIQEQIHDNIAVLQDLEKRTTALEAVKKAADDVLVKAGSLDEPAVKDITMKLDHLNYLWDTIQTAARNRGKSLEDALIAAEKFWDELTAVMKALQELKDNLNHQELPAVEPSAVQQQQDVLLEIKQEISQTKPEVYHCRQAGEDLMQLCGEPDKPEVKKHIEDLDSAWENVTTLYAKREQNLIDAMEKAMTFHDTLQNLFEFLDTAEEKFSTLGAVSTDIESIKRQVIQLKSFKTEVDPHMVEVEALNRQAQELVERTLPDQALAIREPLKDINRRWGDLLKGIVDRQQEMENVLLKLGEFQHTLEELATWMTRTENAMDELKPVFGDPQVIEVVLAKHKVLVNDIQAHEASIEAVNTAGRQLGETDEAEDMKSTRNKLNGLNLRWQHLQEKSADRQRELEEALKEAVQFYQEIQDLLMWISDLDGQLVTSKPVGGLPETAKEQLFRFMDMYNELDNNRHKIENVLQQGENYSKRSSESSVKKLQHSLHTLRQRWENVLNKANDRKIKLEIALREATEFHEALQTFVEWLTNSEKYLTSLKPVSRSMKLVMEQIEDHKNFQKDVGLRREVMMNLDKKGTHLKYFSQKQDVILIKNLLISVQHRWERVVSKAAERTRLLDHGYKEAKEFHDSWTSLSNWLDEAEKTLDSITHISNDPLKIKHLLAKHKEFQRILGSKQTSFDSTMRIGRALKDKCPKHDIPSIQSMMDELKSRWNRVCSKSVDRQRQLEEALLYSGQFKEAVQVLLDWLEKSISKLSDSKNYHGDLDTVTAIIEKHKVFEEEMKSRGSSLETLRKTSEELKNHASAEDSLKISADMEKLESNWTVISTMNESYKNKLDDALKQAERLHKEVHIMLEWMSDAEMKLRFIGPLPEDEETTKKQIASHQEFLKELEAKESNKDGILQLAQSILKKCHPDGISVIRHYITIIESRWEEISLWAKQRDQRLQVHLKSIRDILKLLEELLAWLIKTELTLTSLEAEPLPDDLDILQQLLKEHQAFMDDITKRQPDVDKITKAFSLKGDSNRNLSQAREKVAKGSDKSRLTPTGPTKTPAMKQDVSDIRHPKARLLLEKWRQVWLLAMERQRRLQEKIKYLKELQRIKNFDFDEWRRRYLGWLNNKKSRIMDQYKKIDKNNHGKVTKQEFIDGILQSKFTTSRLEMERVADVFDINGDGFIDTKEYIDTLRPDREEQPLTEAEKIQDEVQRQVAKCTCVHRFKVYQVGEGKYRFGDSQKLRLVRILRSTVMVRVGGGWVALDEFLVKNDPCRAKGRTNLELREQFILAEGVSQSMSPFKPKASPNSSVSSQSGTTPRSLPSAGPITKIREKSERSTPMHKGRSADTSSDMSGTSFSDSKSFSNKSGASRQGLAHNRQDKLSKGIGQRTNSRPSSRGSHTSSRNASDLSQDGIDSYKKVKRGTPDISTENAASVNKTSLDSSVKSKIPYVRRSTPKSQTSDENQKDVKSK